MRLRSSQIITIILVNVNISHVVLKLLAQDGQRIATLAVAARIGLSAIRRADQLEGGSDKSFRKWATEKTKYSEKLSWKLENIAKEDTIISLRLVQDSQPEL